MDLFTHAAANRGDRPLADALRPQSLDEIVGHETLLGPESALGKLLRAGHLPNLILWGPPGTGKTTLAMVLAQSSGAAMIALNAVDSGAKALREAGEEGRRRRLTEGRKTVLFVDEIHRFNRSQQDVLLPYLEKGDLILLGATTENPSYELNRALLSRSRVVVFERLGTADLRRILERAAKARDFELSSMLSPDAIERLLDLSDGDGRRLLNALEILQAATGQRPGDVPLGPDELVGLLQQTPLAHDKSSEMHYDLISAFIKSIRGSDPDAGVYYLARMLAGGEDPIFIARRLVILASEDVGNADPRALSMAVAGLQAVEAIGLPEGGITLAQVVTYLASAPKSNRSYLALREAQALVRQSGSLPVPVSLRSAKTELAKELGYGEDYAYPHDHPKAWVEQGYLPEELRGRGPLYRPGGRGFEKNIRDYLEWLKSGGKPSPDGSRGS